MHAAISRLLLHASREIQLLAALSPVNAASERPRLAQVLREAFRVLKPGGRFAVSDVVTRGAIDPKIRQNVLLWVGCVAGALDEQDYRENLKQAGFEQVEVEPTRIYRTADAKEFLKTAGIDADAIAPDVDGKIMSAFVRAVKPAAAACCGASCCS